MGRTCTHISIDTYNHHTAQSNAQRTRYPCSLHRSRKRTMFRVEWTGRSSIAPALAFATVGESAAEFLAQTTTPCFVWGCFGVVVGGGWWIGWWVRHIQHEQPQTHLPASPESRPSGAAPPNSAGPTPRPVPASAAWFGMVVGGRPGPGPGLGWTAARRCSGTRAGAPAG